MEDLKMTSLRSQFGFSLNQPNINVKIQKFWYVWEAIVRLYSIAITLIMATWLTLVYQVEDDQIEFCQSSVFKSWDNGEYHLTYYTPVTEDVEDINTRKGAAFFLTSCRGASLLLSREVMVVQFLK